MSVVPMKLLTVAGPLEQFDAVVRDCIINQAFHPERALPLMQSVQGLRPFDPSNPYAAPLRRAEQVADEVGIPLEYVPFQETETDLEALCAYFDQVEARLQVLSLQRERLLQDASDDRDIVSQLENLRGVTDNLEALWHLSYARFRYGYLPRETYDSFQESLSQQENILFFPTNLGPKLVYGVYFTTKDYHSKADSLFNSLHFVRIRIDARTTGSAAESMEALTAAAQQATAQAQATADTLAAYKLAQHDRLLAAYSYLRYQNDSHDLRRFAAYARNTFYLMGWVPQDALPGLQAALAAVPNLSYVVDDAGDFQQLKPPTKLKNCRLGQVFQPFLEMYGLPAYHEIDPSLFMAITYTLFFGIMFGDVGQGLCLALVGAVLARWKKLWLGNIMVCCGLSGAAFGCVYGSVFGFEDILPGFKLLEGNHVMVLLVLSMALGVLLLVAVMVLNIINGVKQKNFEKILFGPNGAAGILFYLGIIVMGICTLTGTANLVVAAYILPVLVLPLVLMLLREPLAMLLSHNPAWRHLSLGSIVGTGIFELFETLLSYLTNTLSFMRVGAYAITHVGLMLVVHLLAGSGQPVVLVLGNLFVMGFEGLLVGIQVLRLEFYELFGRFYDDDGTAFSPRVIDYSKRNA